MTLILPLVVMFASYLTIIPMIYKRAQKARSFGQTQSQGVFGKARFATIKVTGVLILGLWSGHYVMTFW
jgi:hypothetical protein